MPVQDNNVTIVAWPATAANLEHSFAPDSPCSVTLSFDSASPAQVVLQATPDEPINVAMEMTVSSRQPIALCHELCQPICARSDYTVGISVFDHPVVAITVRGLTRFFGCKEEI